jgi:hypothetical protein
MLHSCKSNADAGESFIGRCTDEVYDSVRELARFLTERITDLKAGNTAKNDEELAKVEKELQRYRDYTEPAMVNVEEIRNRFKDVACSIDPEEGKELLRKARMEKNIAPGESEGLRTMEERDYEGLYNAMEQIVEENFPKGEESHFFHFGNEYSFYDSLNNSREESGCAHVGPESHADLMRKVKEKGGFAPNYIPRL